MNNGGTAGLMPEPGQRYRFTDFVGATWEATFAGIEKVGTHWRLTFEDHPPFETNMPMSFAPIEEPA